MQTSEKPSNGSYRSLIDKIESIVGSGREQVEVYQEVCSLLRRSIPHYTWVGIYIVEGKLLKLRAYDGPAATEHTEIEIGRGVCGWAAKTGVTEIVPDVNKDPRYLQCFTSTRSEIVVPMKDSFRVYGEMDIDSDKSAAFTASDKEFLDSVAVKLLKVTDG